MDLALAKITDLQQSGYQIIKQVADILVLGFKESAPDAWPDLISAMKEIQESFSTDRISRVALDANGNAIGWIAGIRQYEGKSWELHPLVVRPDRQRRGIGTALVADLEAIVKSRGGVTVYLGTDDEVNLTSLSDVDLYPNVLGHLSKFENSRGHPYEFYQKVGYEVVGVIPDANGWGKPDILMAKRVV
ncbi:GNAT family N-acetyltransferase [bacterium]|nr:GNAT family N-acetyltransferase [bacterium]